MTSEKVTELNTKGRPSIRLLMSPRRIIRIANIWGSWARKSRIMETTPQAPRCLTMRSQYFSPQYSGTCFRGVHLREGKKKVFLTHVRRGSTWVIWYFDRFRNIIRVLFFFFSSFVRRFFLLDSFISMTARVYNVSVKAANCKQGNKTLDKSFSSRRTRTNYLGIRRIFYETSFNIKNSIHSPASNAFYGDISSACSYSLSIKNEKAIINSKISILYYFLSV